MATSRQSARSERRDRLLLRKIQALATARTTEEQFGAELDLYRLLVARLPQDQREQALTAALRWVRQSRAVTFGDLHNLTSPATSHRAVRVSRAAQARVRA